MTRTLQEDLRRLLDWFEDFDSVLVAYSGGVDSSLLMACAHRVLGERALSCIGRSPSYPRRELEAAVGLARRLGAAHRLVDTHELDDPNYAANPDNRCFFCKAELYGRLHRMARDEGWEVVVDGTNADDLGDHRPGRVAAEQEGVRSPLVELGLDKKAVRGLARLLDLPVWDKPAMACLSSRIPHGTSVDAGLLGRIEAAEDHLVDLGLRQFRVRHHGPVARIEVEPEDMPLLLERREGLVARLRELGWRHVSLDLAGFRSGGLGATAEEAS